MNSSSLLHTFLILTLLLGLAKPDPDPLQDYCIADSKASFYLNGVPCINPNLATTAYFTTSALAKAGNTRANPFGFNVTLTNTAILPGINTLGLTLARVDLDPSGIVPPHSHPRASEVTICLKGSILVGFVDSSNNLYTQQLRDGESFVFPKGLIHFLSNNDPMRPALAISGLSSQNPGAQIASLSVFRSNPFIPDDVVKKAFQITSQDVMRIRRNLGG
ncbi:germin-like protein subfamily 1 member 1 [Ricinus communis]|uniref:Germin-like protein n=1 Tax=Ricinus communis TaxID=3988 RepID=B9S2I5_RICCO|nr:germin-like protein subfamily 1 member 1 [Ricinus communis]EEF42259.1 Nectarin-1 precursor, putative [Ricinus communis]|eukprot:XP_002520204.1 germin-like protein subfamily 1 member 1 [Ricinus communis]